MPRVLPAAPGGGNLTACVLSRGCGPLGRGVDDNDCEKLFNKFMNVLPPPCRGALPAPGVAPSGQMSWAEKPALCRASRASCFCCSAPSCLGSGSRWIGEPDGVVTSMSC